MASLIVRDIDDAIVQALKQRASRNGLSAEAEHRNILAKVLLHPTRKSFAEVLLSIPAMENDDALAEDDFERVQEDATRDVFV